MEKVLIVGAGPSAYVAAATCLESDLEIFMLSPKILDWNVFANSDLMKKPILKRRNDDFLFREPIGITKIKGENVDVFENFLIGGLSELWGGVFLPPTNKEYLRMFSDSHARMEAIEFIEKNISILNINNHIYNVYRNLDFKDEVICDNAPIAKSSILQNRNWSAKENITQKLISRINFFDGYLKTLKQTAPGNVQVTVEDLNQNKIILNFDKIFIAAGVFGTARIILDSLDGLTEIKIEDSRSTFKLGLKVGKKEFYDGTESMSPETVYSKIDSKGDVIKFIQVYRISDELINSIKYTLIKHCVRIADRIFLQKLRLVMYFYPGSNSKTIHIFKHGKVLKAIAKNKKNSIRSSSRRNAIKINKFLFFTPELNLRSGAGVHSGAFNVIQTDSSKGVISKDICDWPDVHVLGSASLKSISAGPIMFSAMVNTRIIVKNVINGVK